MPTRRKLEFSTPKGTDDPSVLEQLKRHLLGDVATGDRTNSLDELLRESPSREAEANNQPPSPDVAAIMQDARPGGLGKTDNYDQIRRASTRAAAILQIQKLLGQQ